MRTRPLTEPETALLRGEWHKSSINPVLNRECKSLLLFAKSANPGDMGRSIQAAGRWQLARLHAHWTAS